MSNENTSDVLAQLDNTDRLICNMTFSGVVMTLTLGQLFKMTFYGQIIVHSTPRRKEHDAGKINVPFLSQKLLPKNRKNDYFSSVCPPEATPLILGQI